MRSPRFTARGSVYPGVAAGLRAAHRVVLNVVLVSAVAVGLAGCSASVAEQQAAEVDADTDPRPVVLTTFTVLADIAENVAGNTLRVESITKPGAEIHGYEPTPGDLRRAAEADLIIDNGLNLEAWFARFTQDLDVPHVVASDGVETIDIAEDAHEGMPNPHAWMSPLNVQIYVDNLAEAFSELDPTNTETYEANAAEYSAQIQQVHDELISELSVLDDDQRALVTCEGAFSYLARDAGLTEKYIWAVNAEQQATPKQIASTIEFVEEHNVPAVFCESTVSDAVMQEIAVASGANFGGTLYVDSLSLEDGPVPTYLDLIRYDSRVIIEGLTGGAS